MKNLEKSLIPIELSVPMVFNAGVIRQHTMSRDTRRGFFTSGF